MTIAPTLDRLMTLHIPGPSVVDSYGQSQPGPETDYEVWASRRDVSASEQLDHDNDVRLNVGLTRIVTRWRNDVDAGMYVTDDEGTRRRIIGVSQLGRMRHIQLLAERIE